MATASYTTSGDMISPAGNRLLDPDPSTSARSTRCTSSSSTRCCAAYAKPRSDNQRPSERWGRLAPVATLIMHPMPQQKAQQLLAGTATITPMWGAGPHNPGGGQGLKAPSSRIASCASSGTQTPSKELWQMPGAKVLNQAHRVSAVVLHPVPCPKPAAGRGIRVGATTSQRCPERVSRRCTP